MPLQHHSVEGRTQHCVLQPDAGCETVYSINEAVEAVANEVEAFVIGGGMIYRQFYPIAGRLYLTMAHKDFEADTFFPEVNFDEWNVASREDLFDEKNNFDYSNIDLVRILTVGGDAASKGAQEVMQALSIIDSKAPDWKYVCKVWPQPRTIAQNLADLQMATDLGIQKNVMYETNTISRNFMPYLVGACDIYAAPSRLEGFGMPQVEAGACGKPVISIKAMGMLDTLIDGETALLANVAKRIVVNEVMLGRESGFEFSK